MTDLMKW